MTRRLVQIAIPSILLILAVLWATFGSNLFNDGYGLKRDKAIENPVIQSTDAQYTSFNDLKGHTTYLTFGFSHCTESCPFTLSQFIKLADTLPSDIRLIFVSVDNERDDTDHLKTYLSRVHPNIIGWTMTDNDLKQFAEQFNTHVRVSNTGEPEHGSAIQLIDPSGRWVKTYPYLNLNTDAVLQDYQALQQQLIALAPKQRVFGEKI